MIYLQLFRVFFLIGIFCFGGGYAILPFIQNEVVGNGWITMQEFGDMIAVAESTPGPVSINTATFVGFKLGGVLGAVTATYALCLPAFILVMTVVKLLYTPRGERVMDRLLVGIRPVVAGMIFFAAWSIAQTVFFAHATGAPMPLNPLAVLVAVICFALSHFYKVSPIRMIIAAAVIGIVLAVL